MIRVRSMVVLCSLLSTAGLGVLPAARGSAVPLSLEMVARRAELIVVGRVSALSEGYWADWPGVGRTVFTDVSIEVGEVWKGNVEGARITLQVPGGRLADGSRVAVSEAPVFQLDEKVLVFAYTHLGRPWVYGWDQGKYSMMRKRVVGKKGYPVAEDILSGALRNRIDQILAERK